MRSISQWLANSLSTRSQVRFKVTSNGRQFAVSTMLGFSLLDALLPGKQWVRKANALQPTLCQYKTALEEVRRDPQASVNDTLMLVMPQVVTYVRSLNERAPVQEEQHFVVYL